MDLEKILSDAAEAIHHYKVKCVCTNCRAHNDYFIPIGTRSKGFITNQKCANCGCQMTLSSRVWKQR